MNIQGRGYLFLFAFLILSFQNCSQRGDIALQANVASNTDVTGAGDPSVTPEDCKDCGISTDGKYFIFKPTEDAAQLPPLKLFFIVDNSVSMLDSQINLANSFKTLFDSSSGQNLAKFDGEIFIFTTAMLNSIYLEKFGSNIPSKDPVSTLLNKSFDELFSLRSPLTTGIIPGDIAGHIVLGKPLGGGGQLKQSFISPVHGLTKNADGSAALVPSISFKKGGSLEELQSDFQTRLKLLDPAKYSNPTEHQYLTAGESALCGMARLLRDPGPYINQGDHLSFVVVSDENETNPEGFRCVRTVQYDSAGTWNNFEYIAGNAADGPASDLKTYVKNRLSELLGGAKASFSFFVRLQGDPTGESGSTGTEYINFGKTVGAQMNSVLMSSYSSALQNLSSLIKSSVQLTYQLPLPVGSQIVNLYRKSSAGDFQVVSSSLWSSGGSTITLSPELNVRQDDEFQVELH